MTNLSLYKAALSNLINDDLLIVGFGVENRCAYKFISTVLPTCKIAIADQQIPSDLPSGVTTYCGDDYLTACNSYTTILRAPGVPLNKLPSNKKILTATQIFFHLTTKPIIGITGTKGKSTTTALIAHLLNAGGVPIQLLGNIGIPILEGLPEKGDYSVVELSSFHLEDLNKSPAIAVLLDIAPEHLDHHGSVERYRSAKYNIARHQTSEGVLFAHEHHRAFMAELGAGRRKSFFTTEHCSEARTFITNNELFDKATNTSLLHCSELPLRGTGNLFNIMMALEVGYHFGVSPTTMAEALKTFTPLPHRLEFVGTVKDISFYNDSLCTVPQALAHAINAFGDKVRTVIVGGYDRGIDFSDAGKAIANSAVENIIYFPTTGAKILHHALLHTKRPLVAVEVHSMKDAVEQAFNLTSKDTICLLSPASPSFSIFKDYADRGNQFKYWVNYHRNERLIHQQSLT